MNLRDYIMGFDKKSRARVREQIAEKLGVTENYIVSICSGNRPFPVKFALQIEEITNGKVPCWETAPEVYPPNRFKNQKIKSKAK